MSECDTASGGPQPMWKCGQLETHQLQLCTPGRTAAVILRGRTRLGNMLYIYIHTGYTIFNVHTLPESKTLTWIIYERPGIAQHVHSGIVCLQNPSKARATCFPLLIVTVMTIAIAMVTVMTMIPMVMTTIAVIVAHIIASTAPSATVTEYAAAVDIALGVITNSVSTTALAIVNPSFKRRGCGIWPSYFWRCYSSWDAVPRTTALQGIST